MGIRSLSCPMNDASNASAQEDRPSSVSMSGVSNHHVTITNSSLENVVNTRVQIVSTNTTEIDLVNCLVYRRQGVMMTASSPSPCNAGDVHFIMSILQPPY